MNKNQHSNGGVGVSTIDRCKPDVLRPGHEARLVSLPAVLLALCALARSAAAQTFPITFDPRALGSTRFNVFDRTVGTFLALAPTNQLSTAELAPGPYEFRSPAGSPDNLLPFSVSSTGTVDFDSTADSYASGRGTSTLTVSGLPITVDARGLSPSTWSLTASEGGGGSTSQVSTIRVLPGLYRFETPASHAGMTFHFTLGIDGILQFDPALDAYVSGRGTSALTVAGFPLTIDATALSHPDFNMLSGGAGSGLSSQVTTFRFLPTTASPLTFQSPSSTQNLFPFTFSTSGIVDYDLSLDAYVSGRGTSTLTISGFPITIDATAVPVPDWNIAYAFGGPNQVRTARQVPGLYDLHLPASSNNVVYYTVTGLGTIDFDPVYDFCVRGRGTNVLEVLCDPSSTPDPLQLIADLKTYIHGLSPSVLKNSNAKLVNASINKLDAVRSQVEAAQAETDPAVQDQLLQDAVDKIRHDILAKTDGCGATGAPDSNDWITACAVQAEVSLRLNRIIAAITALI
jgi:hypothetical protein